MASNTSGDTLAVELELVRDMENKIASKNLSDMLHKVHNQRHADDVIAREETRRRHQYRGSNQLTRSVNSSIISASSVHGDGATVATGNVSSDGSNVFRKKKSSPSKAQDENTNLAEEDDSMSFTITKEREQALADVIRERKRMIHLNDKLCMDESKMKPQQRDGGKRKDKSSARSSASFGDAEGESVYSSEEDDHCLSSSFQHRRSE